MLLVCAGWLWLWSPKFQKLKGLSLPPPLLPSLLLLPDDFGTAEEATAMLRFSALTMPVVTVFGRSSGAPIATTGSPPLRRLESAKVAGVSPDAFVSLITARSFSGSVPAIFAG